MIDEWFIVYHESHCLRDRRGFEHSTRIYVVVVHSSSIYQNTGSSSRRSLLSKLTVFHSNSSRAPSAGRTSTIDVKGWSVRYDAVFGKAWNRQKPYTKKGGPSPWVSWPEKNEKEKKRQDYDEKPKGEIVDDWLDWSVVPLVRKIAVVSWIDCLMSIHKWNDLFFCFFHFGLLFLSHVIQNKKFLEEKNLLAMFELHNPSGRQTVSMENRPFNAINVHRQLLQRKHISRVEKAEFSHLH